MTMLVHYKTKKELKAAIGEPLRYTETSIFGPEYLDTGSFMVAHRPRIQKNGGREFSAKVTMSNGRIAAVE